MVLLRDAADARPNPHRHLSRGVAALVGVVVYVCVSSPTPSSAQDSKSWTDRFFNEAPEKWGEYRSFATRLQGSVVTTSRVTDPTPDLTPGQLHRQYRHEYKQNDRCASFFRPLPGKGGGEGVSVSNPRYAFLLKRPGSGQDWLLANLDIKERDGRSFGDGRSVRELVNGSIMSHFQVYGYPLPDLIREARFKVTRASRITRDGRELVRVDFDYPHPIDLKNFTPVQGGSLLLDPDHCWCLRESEIKGKWTNGTGTARVKFEFKDGSNGFPILGRTHFVLKNDPPRVSGMEIVSDYDLREASRLPPDEEFTLTAYGLPEPVGMQKPGGSRAYIWFALAGFGVLALAAAFRKAARRRRDRVSPSA